MRKISVRILTLMLIIAGAAGPAMAADRDGAPALAIQGYSPVSYFEAGEPQMGSPEHSAVYDGFVYHFTSAEQRERFESDPEAYAPLFPNHCPYHLALGRAVAIDPTNYKIIGGHLLMFHREDEMDGLREWENHDDQDQLLERSKSTWTLLRFSHP